MREFFLKKLFLLAAPRRAKTERRLFSAFTLAEVLITLAIIGVVAALTLPGFINETKKQETVSQVKKVYSVLSQAFALAESDGKEVKDWGWLANNSSQGARNAVSVLAPYLNITKNCGTNTGCFPAVQYPSLNNVGFMDIDGDATYAKFILNDGSLIGIISRSPDCSYVFGTNPALSNACGIIFTDVNGFKGPNKMAKDLFVFYITKYGVYPRGIASDTGYPPSDCAKTGTGKACAAWIIEKGSMDYLK